MALLKSVYGGGPKPKKKAVPKEPPVKSNMIPLECQKCRELL